MRGALAAHRLLDLVLSGLQRRLDVGRRRPCLRWRSWRTCRSSPCRPCSRTGPRPAPAAAASTSCCRSSGTWRPLPRCREVRPSRRSAPEAWRTACPAWSGVLSLVMYLTNLRAASLFLVFLMIDRLMPATWLATCLPPVGAGNGTTPYCVVLHAVGVDRRVGVVLAEDHRDLAGREVVDRLHTVVVLRVGRVHDLVGLHQVEVALDAVDVSAGEVNVGLPLRVEARRRRSAPPLMNAKCAFSV